jgi:hypothetical protein
MNTSRDMLLSIARDRFKEHLNGRKTTSDEIFLFAFQAGWESRSKALKRNIPKWAMP